jgi:hypothetical protein
MLDSFEWKLRSLAFQDIPSIVTPFFFLQLNLYNHFSIPVVLLFAKEVVILNWCFQRRVV